MKEPSRVEKWGLIDACCWKTSSPTSETSKPDVEHRRKNSRRWARTLTWATDW